MTGSTGTFGTATLTFGAGTTGLGFYGLDLTSGEIIRLSVNFVTGPNQIFDITLGGEAVFTPIYFGVIDSSDTILSATILGTDTDDLTRAWKIDDLSINATVPVPAAVWLFGSGLLGLIGIARRKKAA